MHRFPTIALALCLGAALAPTVDARKTDELQARRDAIDDMAVETMERLFTESPGAKSLYGKAAGFAVFDNFKVSLLLSGSGGVGVAVDNRTGRRTYMKSGGGGVGLGLGGHSYQLVVLFETRDALERFLGKTWQVDAAASAAAGTSGTATAATFTDGIAVYQLTNKGLVAQADVTGTRYWRSRALNGD
jgi:lipid-binding SYLF domain-containing protein